ncbi:MAG: GxxExxY protein [Flavobacterium sp. JAD_PAG50586_2]|nr:MAG: GxxExxY protein [Flavobacterium sp. JAD_PAG50586_2]
MTKSYLKDLTHQINSAALEVHEFLGPGLLEDVYEKCLRKELAERGISFQTGLSVPVKFKGIELETNLKCGIFVENCIVVESKAIQSIESIHQAEILTYMKLLDAPVGILFNFHTVNLFGEGQKTFVNEVYRNNFGSHG